MIRRHVVNVIIVSLLTLASFPATVSAADNEKRLYTRTTTGVIRDINLSKRQAIVSGYKYYFGSPVYGDAADVDMYDADFGSLEMLKVGMKVFIRYAEYGNIRYVVHLEQISDLADVEK